jgi:hypothetical protein
MADERIGLLWINGPIAHYEHGGRRWRCLLYEWHAYWVKNEIRPRCNGKKF